MNADVAVAALLAATVGAVYLAALVFAITQIVRAPGVTLGERAVWIVAFLVAPVIAAVVWFVAGPHPFGIRFGTPAFR